MKTTQEIINELSQEELKENPDKLSQYLIILSASLEQAGYFETDAEINYCKKWEEIKNNTVDIKGKPITDKMVEMKAKQTEEYRLWQKMRIRNKTIIELIRSIKKRLQNLNITYSEGQNY